MADPLHPFCHLVCIICIRGCVLSLTGVKVGAQSSSCGVVENREWTKGERCWFTGRVNTNLSSRQAMLSLAVWTLAGSFLAHGGDAVSVFQADVKVPMRDGIQLAANIYRPEENGRYPVVLMRSPYGKMGQDWADAKRYTAAGYAMVVQDCRGRGKSEGVWDPFRYDLDDGVDTQAWVMKQPWCNGKIGTAGGSYLGWTQWAPVADAGPGLKAMVPVVPFDNAYEIGYCGGAFQLALLMGWGTLDGMGDGCGRGNIESRQNAECFPASPVAHLWQPVRKACAVPQ
jgi:predicted acyl esterase